MKICSSRSSKVPLSYVSKTLFYIHQLKEKKLKLGESSSISSIVEKLINILTESVNKASHYLSGKRFFTLDQKEACLGKAGTNKQITLSDGTLLDVPIQFSVDFPRDHSYWLLNGKAVSGSMENYIEQVYQATGKQKERTTQILQKLGQTQGNQNNAFLFWLSQGTNLITMPKKGFHSTSHLKVSKKEAVITSESKFIRIKGDDPDDEMKNAKETFHVKATDNVLTQTTQFELEVESLHKAFKDKQVTLNTRSKEMLKELSTQATQQHPEQQKKIRSVYKKFAKKIKTVPLVSVEESSTNKMKQAALRTLKEKNISILQQAKLEISDVADGKAPSPLNHLYHQADTLHHYLMKLTKKSVILYPFMYIVSMVLTPLSYPFKYFLRQKLNRAFGTTTSKEVEVQKISPTHVRYHFRAREFTLDEVKKQFQIFQKKRRSFQEWKPIQHVLSSEELSEFLEKSVDRTLIQKKGEVTSGVIPLNTHFDPTFEPTHGIHGYATSDRKGSEHLVNGWLSQASVGEKKLSLFRHASFSPLEGDLSQRKQIAQQVAQELLKGVLLNHLNEHPNEYETTKPLSLKLAQISLFSPNTLTPKLSCLAPDFFRKKGLNEKELYELHHEALSTLKGRQTLEIIHKGESKKVDLDIKILPFNFAINEFAHQFLGTQKVQSQLNETSVRELQLVYRRKCSKWKKNPKKAKKMKRVKTLYDQVFRMYKDVESRKSLEFTSRLAILLHELGYTLSFNCKSGKDRTSYAVSRLKALFIISQTLGYYPTPEQISTPGPIRTAIVKLHKKLMEKEDHSLAEKNLGVSGLKSSSILREYQDVIPNIQQLASNALAYDS